MSIAAPTIPPITHSMNGYSPTQKERRQIVVEQVGKLPLVEIERGKFLSSEKAIAVIAKILIHKSIQTDVEYQRIGKAFEIVCIELGFGEEQFLDVPDVSFSERGMYRPKLPIVDLATVEAALIDTTVVYLSTPLQAVQQSILHRYIAFSIWQKNPEQLTVHLQNYVQQICTQCMQQLGWQSIDSVDDSYWYFEEGAYIKQIMPDWEEMEKQCAYYLEDGRPIDHHTLTKAAVRGAFNYRVESDPDDFLNLAITLPDLLEKYGYQPDADQNGVYHPAPLSLPENGIAIVCDIFKNAPTLTADIGPVIAAKPILQTIWQQLGLGERKVTLYQQEQMLTEGIIGQALIQLGYQRNSCWMSPWRLTPKPEAGIDVFVSETAIRSEPKSFTVASGFTVQSPVMVRDDETLVYLEMVGPRQAVKANWAALKNGRSRPYICGSYVRLRKDDKHQLLKRALPIGWDHWCLIHQQAHFNKMKPNQPFYLLHQADTIIPSPFYSMLNKALSLPLLPEWADYLWLKGRMHNLIEPLTENSHGQAGWRVSVEADAWQALVSQGLQEGRIYFGKRKEVKIDVKEPVEMIIHEYSRDQAFEDGVLVNASVGELAELSRQHYKWPIAMTAAVHALIEKAVSIKAHGNDWKGVWHDILTMSKLRNRDLNSSIRQFQVIITTQSSNPGDPRNLHTMKIVSGPIGVGDKRPCLTVMMVNED